jgi:hypothetical protein
VARWFGVRRVDALDALMAPRLLWSVGPEPTEDPAPPRRGEDTVRSSSAFRGRSARPSAPLMWGDRLARRMEAVGRIESAEDLPDVLRRDCDRTRRRAARRAFGKWRCSTRRRRAGAATERP